MQAFTTVCALVKISLSQHCLLHFTSMQNDSAFETCHCCYMLVALHVHPFTQAMAHDTVMLMMLLMAPSLIT